jgi:hypothetical protein
MNHPIIEFALSMSFPPIPCAFVFDDNIEQTIDFRPILAGELYGPDVHDPTNGNAL